MNWLALLTSKTVWGIVIATAAPLLQKHGVTVDAEGTANEVVALAGTALALYGRVTASGPLTK